jgi:glycine oxidase
VQVAIVGAGVVGCAIAHELSSRGAGVQVIEMRGTGLGATRASAGILAPHIEGHTEPVRALGLASLDLYDTFISRIRTDSGHAIEYQRTGTLEVAATLEEADVLAEKARHLADAGVAHTFLDGLAARGLEPGLSVNIAAGLLVPVHGYVGAAALTDALALAASKRGAQWTSGDVQRIESLSGRIRITTSAGAITADAVVVAAGSWAGRLSTPAMPVRPIRGQLLHLQLPRPAAARVIWGTGCYVVPWQDGSLLVGATVEDVGFDEAATVAAVRQLLEEGRKVLPAVESARFREVRVGLRPATPDELPLVGASSTMPGVFYAAGHYRNGVLLAPLTASLIADLVLDGRAGHELALVRPERFGL